MKYFFMLPLLLIILGGSGCKKEETPDVIYQTGELFDIEGNRYVTIKIGKQWWMAENLRTTLFRDGTPITRIEDKATWEQTTLPALTAYNNLPGITDWLYNFHAVNAPAQLAPYGWHIPTDDDWKILESHLGMHAADMEKTNWRGTHEGDALKVTSTNTSGWISHLDVWGTNESGFAAEGGSCRIFNGDWGYPGLRHSGYWWSSTVGLEGYGWFRSLDYQHSGIFRYAAHPNYGFSVRCVKD